MCEGDSKDRDTHMYIMYIHTMYVLVCMYLHTCTYIMYIHTCTLCTYTHVHPPTHACTHTHTNTHTHTQKLMPSFHDSTVEPEVQVLSTQ